MKYCVVLRDPALINPIQLIQSDLDPDRDLLRRGETDRDRLLDIDR